jgi:hypothetical protein
MAYTYSAYIAVTDTDRRYKNFTETPTVTVLDGLAAAVIASPAPTLTNLDAVGHYRAAITIATLTDVIFAIAPAAADQAAIADISTLHTKVEQVIDENIDATISSRAEPSDILSDATPFPGAFIDIPISDAGSGTVTVTATVAISATEAAAVASGLLALRSYNTFSQAVTSTSEDDLSAASSVWLAIKSSVKKDDPDSLIFIEATDGLTVLDGAAYATPLNGSLTVSGTAGDWTVTLKVEAAAMAAIGLRVGSYDAEIKYKLGNDVKILWAGAAILSDGVVRAIA